MPLVLARGGQSAYSIVLQRGADETGRLAAEELRQALRDMTGADLPVIFDDDPAPSHIILVGDSRRFREQFPQVDLNDLGDQGFLLQTRERCLAIAGGTSLTTLYGVYALLEEHLGCVWCSSTVSYIPKVDVARLGPLDEASRPAFRWREVYYHDAMDPAFAKRLPLNGNASTTAGGRMTREQHADWDLWCHTFYTLVPPERYAKDHPEYYSLVGGQRNPGTQLCLTNPGVLRTTIEALRERMEVNPTAHYWSVSQNDTGGACECEACAALDRQEGTHMGSLLSFVNKIAAAFPDKEISTLAYQYTRQPPKLLRPAPNVAIMLCSIECNRSRPIASDPSSAGFRDDIRRWAELSGNLQLWDYVVQFSNLVSPFPNLRVLQPDMRFFRDSHVTAVFSQGNREFGGEFAELRTYLLAHLQWDPDCDVEALIQRFLNAYYGAAAEPIGRYIAQMHDSLEASGAGLGIFDGPANHGTDYLSSAMLDQYTELFDDAEQRVAGDPELLLRVRTARMPLEYALLELRHGDVTFRRAAARRLFETADRIGLRMFNEWNLPTEEYRKRAEESLRAE